VYVKLAEAAEGQMAMEYYKSAYKVFENCIAKYQSSYALKQYGAIYLQVKDQPDDT
jgi:hypothetical protein